MKAKIKVGILGDFDPAKTSHPATNQALSHAARQLSIEVEAVWVPTPSLLDEKELAGLSRFDCLWASSGSPYQSSAGMLAGIREARRLGVPFIGT